MNWFELKKELNPSFDVEEHVQDALGNKMSLKEVIFGELRGGIAPTNYRRTDLELAEPVEHGGNDVTCKRSIVFHMFVNLD